MSRYTKQERARILAEADMHRAIRRADVLREKHLLLLQKEKMAERQPREMRSTDHALMARLVRDQKNVTW